MKLYPKKLRSVAELEREKARLLKQSKQLDNVDILNGFKLGNSKKEDKKGSSNTSADSGILDTVFQLLPVSDKVSGILKDYVLPIVMKRAASSKSDDGSKERSMGSKAGKIAKKVAWEVLGGYLKWKAVELSYKGIRYLVKTQKAKKEK